LPRYAIIFRFRHATRRYADVILLRAAAAAFAVLFRLPMMLFASAMMFLAPPLRYVIAHYAHATDIVTLFICHCCRHCYGTILPLLPLDARCLADVVVADAAAAMMAPATLVAFLRYFSPCYAMRQRLIIDN